MGARVRQAQQPGWYGRRLGPFFCGDGGGGFLLIFLKCIIFAVFWKYIDCGKLS